MRCPQCDKEVLKDLKWDNWIKVINFIHFLELQGLISQELSYEMFDCMMSFKSYADEEPTEANKVNDIMMKKYDELKKKVKK